MSSEEIDSRDKASDINALLAFAVKLLCDGGPVLGVMAGPMGEMIWDKGGTSAEFAQRFAAWRASCLVPIAGFSDSLEDRVLMRLYEAVNEYREGRADDAFAHINDWFDLVPSWLKLPQESYPGEFSQRLMEDRRRMWHVATEESIFLKDDLEMCDVRDGGLEVSWVETMLEVLEGELHRWPADSSGAEALRDLRRRILLGAAQAREGAQRAL